jgi:serine/threonine-protein kinase
MAAEPRRIGEHSLPKQVGRYEAFLQIGAGGMARVYLAVQRVKGAQPQLVVVKILRPEAIEDEHVLALFMDEARIAMRLHHPNVIRTREVIAEPPDYLLAMDFQNGQSLLQVLRRLGRPGVPLDEHIYILTKVLAGLSYAHELKDEHGQPFGIVHRDVSPANVLVSYTGEVKLLDFGIAKATGALAATQDGVVKGKLGYAAPEQCLGKPADPRSDLYAVGVMLWEAIAGRRRASGETWHSVLQARLDDAEPQLEEVCPEAPAPLTAIVRRALARDPDQRYSTAREFQSDLESYLGEKKGPRIGAVRLAAMLKPHFDQDRADQHKAVQAFLGSLKSGGSGQRRLPLPGGAAQVAPASAPAATTPVVEEEQTSRIPVDAALLIMSRREAAAAQEARAAAGSTRPPPPSAAPTQPPPAATPTAPAPVTVASPVTAPAPPRNTLTGVAPLGITPPSVAPEENRTSSPSLSFAPALVSLPPASFPAPAPDAYGLVNVSKSAPLALASSADVVAPTKKKRTQLWAILLVAGGAAGLGAVGVLPLHKIPAGHVAAATQPTAIAEPAPAPPPAARIPRVDMVKVRISVDPADAIVKLDGRILPTNPFVSTLPKDTEMHELTAFAEGCRDGKQVVHLNQDVDLLVALKHLKGFVRSTAPRSVAATPAAPAAHAPAAPAAQPTVEPHPAAPAAPAAEPGMDLKSVSGDPAPRRHADEENPYTQ